MFWKEWKNLTSLEEKYVSISEKFVEDLVSKFRKKIYCVLFHGSFATRELVEGSDIDYVVITFKKNDVEEIYSFIKNYVEKISEFDKASVRSLEALEKKEKDPDVAHKMSSGAFLLLAKYYELGWGKKLDYSKLESSSPEFLKKKFILKTIEMLGKEYTSKNKSIKSYHKQTAAKFFLWTVYYDLLISGYKGPVYYELIKKKYSKRSLEHEACLVRERRGKNTRDSFVIDIFKRLKLKT